MIKVYKEQEKDEDISLKLITESGVVKVVSVDKAGEPLNGGYICRITKKGLYLIGGITDIDLPLDSCGRIKIYSN